MDTQKIATGQNVIETENPTLEEMHNAALELKAASMTKYVLANKVKPARSYEQAEAYSDPAFLPHTETWEEKYYIEGEVGEYNITDFSRHKMLANLKMAPGFFDRAPSDLRYNALHRLSRDVKNYATLTVVDSGENGKVITGYVTSKSVPLYNHDILEYLANWVQENGFQYKIEHAHMDINHMSFKIVLIDNTIDIKDPASDVNDDYQFGIAIQNSSTGYCETIINPMLFRVVCSNGLIDVKDEKPLIKQQNLALPAEALKVVLGDVLDWMNGSEAKAVLQFLQALNVQKTRWNVKRIKALLPAVLDKVPADSANNFKKALWDVWPENDDTYALYAYDVVNRFTNMAQQYAPTIQSRIEANVLRLLKKASKEASKA